MIYVDDTVAASELAGILVVLGAVWALWACSWLVRVEVHALAAPVVARLGLHWRREGLMPWVIAQKDGLELRFSRGEQPGALRIERREDGAWVRTDVEALT